MQGVFYYAKLATCVHGLHIHTWSQGPSLSKAFSLPKGIHTYIHADIWSHAALNDIARLWDQVTTRKVFTYMLINEDPVNTGYFNVPQKTLILITGFKPETTTCSSFPFLPTLYDT